MIKTIDLELDELDVLLCITGIAYDFDDSDIIGDVVECLISEMKGLPLKYRDLDECRKDAVAHVKRVLAGIIHKLGG